MIGDDKKIRSKAASGLRESTLRIRPRRWRYYRPLSDRRLRDEEILGKEPGVLCYTIYDWLPLFSVLAVGSFILEFFAPLALFNKRIGHVWSVNTFFMHWGMGGMSCCG